MTLYNVKDDYIDYLRKFDSVVLYNKSETRPYVGAVCIVNSTNYYIPLTSPKAKHMYMKNSKDLHKICNGKYGVLNFNNMIPVNMSELIVIDINNEPDPQYRSLLKNQLAELLAIKDVVQRKAVGIYDLFCSKDELTPNDAKVKNRCCNFLLLEQKMKEYAKRI